MGSPTMDQRREQVAAISRRLMAAIGKDAIDFLKANGYGVTLFAFEFGDHGALAYISTADREGMIHAIKEWLAFQEAGLTTEPMGERAQS